ncbi:MAG: endonuclease/exonuclease/phosphatase family protein [Clostridia bacterium]|nr:endonuclease/exonuclease/phosphatase family protein [Clostridia bacterium]
MTDRKTELTLMTFNVLHFEDVNTGRVDIGAYADFIRESAAAFVGLNEVYEDQLAELAGKLGWASFFACGCEIGGRRYGNGIVSRLPLTCARAVPIPDPKERAYGGYYETRVLLLCDAQAGGEKLHIAVTHFGLNPDEQENAVRTALANVLPERQILMGDLNMLPGDPILAPVFEKMTDTAPLLGENIFSFPSDAPDRKIDYVFVSSDLTPLSAEIVPLALSDHRPYRCNIRYGR